MKYDCDMIRDLMPLCADGAASDSSQQAVQSHVAACAECAKLWDEMRQGLDLQQEPPAPQEQGYTKAAKRYKKRWLFRLLGVFFCGLLATWGLMEIYIDSPYYHGRKTVDQAVDEALAGGGKRHYDGLRYKTLGEITGGSGELIRFVQQDNSDCIYAVRVERTEKGLYRGTVQEEIPTIIGRNAALCVYSYGGNQDFAIAAVPYSGPSDVTISIHGRDYDFQIGQGEYVPWICQHCDDPAEITGAALEWDGTVRYVLQPGDRWKNEQTYCWVRPESESE